MQKYVTKLQLNTTNVARTLQMSPNKSITTCTKYHCSSPGTCFQDSNNNPKIQKSRTPKHSVPCTRAHVTRDNNVVPWLGQSTDTTAASESLNTRAPNYCRGWTSSQHWQITNRLFGWSANIITMTQDPRSAESSTGTYNRPNDMEMSRLKVTHIIQNCQTCYRYTWLKCHLASHRVTTPNQ